MEDAVEGIVLRKSRWQGSLKWLKLSVIRWYKVCSTESACSEEGSVSLSNAVVDCSRQIGGMLINKVLPPFDYRSEADGGLIGMQCKFFSEFLK